MNEPHHLHKTLELASGALVRVSVTARAFIALMDDENYELYLADEDFEYYGDTASRSPFDLSAPAPGVWHLVIEQDDPSEQLTVGVQIVD
jgi:hypothetical protein